MTALGRLFRTTAFKLALVYLVVFAGLTLFLIVYISYNTGALITRQIEATIATEINSLAEQYRRGGVRQLVASVEIRARRPGASLYLVADYSGRTIVGNVADLPLAIVAMSDGTPVEISYERLEGVEASTSLANRAIVRIFALPGGFRLLVGRDIGEQDQFQRVIREAFQVSIAVMVVLGLLSWVFINRAVLKRVESIAETSRRIISGDLGQRLAVTGSGDEFDNLAGSLNEMLARIEALMTGLKEVSDNIAHDLKTPLTRLRNRLESALREAGSETDRMEAIGVSIEEADELIQVFDALLKIARVEAGSSGDTLELVDGAETIRDVCELYQPVIEDDGGRCDVTIEGALVMRANRTLIAQALTNLLDNALKYGMRDDGTPLAIKVRGERIDGDIHLTVADNGPGIPPADRTRAMQRFVRLEASRSRPGSGLGLSLVAAIARLYGGRLELGDGAPGLVATLIIPSAATTAGLGTNNDREGSTHGGSSD